MRKSSMPWNLTQLRKMYDNGSIVVDHPIQRRGDQWKEYDKSLLIHSMLSGYIVPAMYFIKELTGEVNSKGKPASAYYVLDGKQRLLNSFQFMDDEFAISEGISGIETDDDYVEIAGLTFSEMPEDLQENIKRYVFTVYNLEDCTDDEIEDNFYRINNGVALTKGQKTRVKFGTDIARFLDEILGSKFYKEVCHFTTPQIRRAADQTTLMQAMLLFDYEYHGYELKSISETDVMNYALSLNKEYSEEKRDRIRHAIEYLECGFSGKEKFMKKINIPMFIFLADYAWQKGIEADLFYEWFADFADRYTPGCDYSQNCSTGSIKREKTLKRISILKDDLDDYVAKSRQI